METFHLAQANWSLWRADVSQDACQGFFNQLDEVNALAEASPGFVWRYVSRPGDPAVVGAFSNERAIFNMSVWWSPAHLKAFAFSGRHGSVMQRRTAWFERLHETVAVLWWIPAGHHPTVAEAKRKLDLINALGPTRDAFSFARLFPPEKPCSR